MSQSQLKATLSATMESFTANPDGAKLVFSAKTKLENGVRCSAKVRNFMPIATDEPPELGGKDSAMNPVELVLCALGTCQEVMYSAYAAVMGIELESVEVDVRGYLDARGLFGMADVFPGYDKIRYETRITSSADPQSIKNLIDAVESHCPVMDTIVRPVAVTGKSFLNGNPVHTTAATGESGNKATAPSTAS